MPSQVCGASGYLSQSSKIVHFGLGDQATFDKVEIIWPSGIKQTLAGVSANTLHEAIELAGERK